MLKEIHAKVIAGDASGVSDQVQAALDAGAEHVFFHPELSEFPQELLPTFRSGDLCLTMGAGSIEFLGEDLLAALRDEHGSGEVAQ
jgi:UDP-N-acetylmuramate-alanine ligase